MKQHPIRRFPQIQNNSGSFDVTQDVGKALDRIYRFCEKYGLLYDVSKPLVQTVIIYKHQSELVEVLKTVYNLQDTSLFPKAMSAVIEDGVLYAVDETEYRRLYEEEHNIEDAYIKLFVHEFAHQLHIQLLNGEEDKMGPKWFFEGFAIYVADQLKTYDLSLKEMIQIIEEDSDEPYIHYAPIFRRLVLCKPIKELIKEACKSDFSIFAIDCIKQQMK